MGIFCGTVVGILREIYNPIGEPLPCGIQCIQIAFGAAVGNVAPLVIFGRAEELGKKSQYFPLHLFAGHTKPAHFGRVTDVV